MKVVMRKEKVEGFYAFEVILRDSEGEEVQVKNSKKETV